MLATLQKYGKLVATVLGAVLMVLNESLAVVPANWTHWVTGAIAVLTVVARDLTSVVDNPLSAKSAKAPTAP